MKKSLYFALAASIVAFASCDDQDFTDWAAPTQIQNAQGNVDQVDGSVTPGSVIVFAELPDGATTVSLFNVSVSGCTLTSVKVKLRALNMIQMLMVHLLLQILKVLLFLLMVVLQNFAHCRQL